MQIRSERRLQSSTSSCVSAETNFMMSHSRSFRQIRLGRILLSPNEEKTAGLAGGASFEQSRPIHTRVRSSREEKLGVPHPFTPL
jgi:hypothetical protein